MSFRVELTWFWEKQIGVVSLYSNGRYMGMIFNVGDIEVYHEQVRFFTSDGDFLYSLWRVIDYK